MAKPHFLFQGIKKDNDHESALKEILHLPDTEEIILSVAFVRESGVFPIMNSLKQNAERITVFAGIRNGITSAQGLRRLLNTGVKLFTVDTGSASIVFHPKVYIALGPENARAIIGSANLTYSGLNGNIEASTRLLLDRSFNEDELFIQDLITAMKSLQKEHPKNVFLISEESEIDNLLKTGRLEDEQFVAPPQVSAASSNNKREQIQRIKIYRKSKKDIVEKPHPFTKTLTKSSKWVLIWISKGLTERDLNIPTGKNTNATGSMLLKKGQLEGIDQRSYFRDVIFSDLSWVHDLRPRLNHLERAQASFEIIVKGISYGNFDLKITHNSKINTRAYAQHNAMTQIHWGTAKSIIAKTDLLGLEMRLYRKGGNEAKFVLEID